jgi:hypothetical protein
MATYETVPGLVFLAFFSSSEASFIEIDLRCNCNHGCHSYIHSRSCPLSFVDLVADFPETGCLPYIELYLSSRELENPSLNNLTLRYFMWHLQDQTHFLAGQYKGQDYIKLFSNKRYSVSSNNTSLLEESTHLRLWVSSAIQLFITNYL